MSQQEQASRRARLAALRERGIEPFPARVGPRTSIAEVRKSFAACPTATLEAQKPRVAVVGRVMANRSFGKLRFLDLVENGQRLQVSVRKGEIAESAHAIVLDLDVGDFIRAEGCLWRTRAGELTLALDSLDFLAKSLRPLPEKWHGLTDVEARFRQRYLDLLVNEPVRQAAYVRSRTIQEMRAFLDTRGFLEVETPILQPLYGGAAARPFQTHHNAYHQALYLRISDELYLKRLVIGGLDRVYEIGRNFRNEGISRKHNPEFTMMECYQAYADYRDMMDLVEGMIPQLARCVLGTTQIVYQGQAIELEGPWRRMSMRAAILETTGIDVDQAKDAAELAVLLRNNGIELADEPTWALSVDALFSEKVEPRLIQPTFITDYPLELSPLAKRSSEDSRLVERFELFLAGFELANAFSELNDPDDQRARFEAQRRAAAAGDQEAHPMDEAFLEALEHGMPPTGGLGVGIDRLVMVLADVPSLREVLLFPHMRHEQG